MAKFYLDDFNEVLGWLSSKFKATSVAAGGKQGLHAAVAGAGAAENAIGNMVMLGGFGVLSTIANQIEYLDERARIAHFYREELAAKSHKTKDKVADSDVTLAEKNNATIDEAVGRERSHRNLGIAASFLASVLVFTLMQIILPGHAEAATVAEAVVGFLAKATVGGLAYLAAKAPLMKLGTTLFGLEQDTTHDLIVDISRDRNLGKAITREQVVEVFVSGNKQLADYVEDTFGKKYKELALADKVRVATELANVLPIDKIVHNINLGSTNASELAFTVQGDVSGALPKAPEEQVAKTSMFSAVAQPIKNLAKSLKGMFGAEKAHVIDTLSAINKTQKPEHSAHTQGESPVEELNQPSFVERHALAPKDSSAVQQLAERRANNVLMPGSPTIQ